MKCQAPSLFAVSQKTQGLPGTAVPTPAFQALTPPACLPSKLAAVCASHSVPWTVYSSEQGLWPHPTLALPPAPHEQGWVSAW